MRRRPLGAEIVDIVNQIVSEELRHVMDLIAKPMTTGHAFADQINAFVSLGDTISSENYPPK